MFWTFMIVTVMSFLLTKLGAISVMAGVLAMALKASLLVLIILAGLLVWRWVRG